MKRALFLFVVLIFVAGCGGGDAVTTDMSEPEEVENIADPEPEPEERFDCFEYDGETLREFLDDIYRPTTSFIREHYGDTLAENLCDGRVNRWTQAPTVRIVSMPEYERSIFPEVIESINKSLPDEYDIEIGEDASRARRPPNGEIHVYIAPKSEWPEPNVSTRGGAYFSFARYREFPVRWGNAFILPYPDEVEGKQRLREITHELLHILFGTHCHPQFPPKWEVILNLGEPEPGEITRLELDALRAIYSQLEPRDYPDELQIDEEDMCLD